MKNTTEAFTDASCLHEQTDPYAFLKATKAIWTDIAVRVASVNADYDLLDDHVEVSDIDNTIGFKVVDLNKGDFTRMEISAKFDPQNQVFVLSVGTEGPHKKDDTARAMPSVETRFPADEKGRQNFIEAFFAPIRTTLEEGYTDIVKSAELSTKTPQPLPRPL